MTLNVTVRDTVYRQIAELAARQQVSVERIVAAALAEQLSGWTRVEQMAERGTADGRAASCAEGTTGLRLGELDSGRVMRATRGSKNVFADCRSQMAERGTADVRAASCAERTTGLRLVELDSGRVMRATRGSKNVFADCGFPPAEAENLRIRSKMMMALRSEER